MRRTIRLGIVGTGVAARRLYLPAFENPKSRVELVACCNRDRKKAQSYAKLARIPKVTNTPEELIALPEVEGVLLSLPIEVMPRYVLHCLEEGKPVLSEKPVAPSLRAGKELLRAASRYDTPWLVGENFAFMSQALKVGDWLRHGRLGDVRLVEVTQITRMDSKNPYFKTSWRKEPAFVGAFVVDSGVHLAHWVRTTFGYPKKILGLGASLDARLPPPDTAVASLAFDSGALGSWRSCFCADYSGPILRVFGSQANAEVFWTHASLTNKNGKSTTYRARTDSFTLQFSHFADVVLGRELPRVTPKDALDDLALVEAIVS